MTTCCSHFPTFSHLLLLTAVPCQPHFLRICHPLMMMKITMIMMTRIMIMIILFHHKCTPHPLLGECQELNFAFSLDRQKVRREENCSPPNVMTDDEQNLETAFFRPESHTVVLDKYGLLRTGRITCGRTNGNGQVQHEGWSGFTTNNIWSVRSVETGAKKSRKSICRRHR